MSASSDEDPNLEAKKTAIDVAKHLSTLSAAVLVFFASFLDRFPRPLSGTKKFYFGASALTLSISLCAYLLFRLQQSMFAGGKDNPHATLKSTMIVLYLSFVLGVGLLFIFVGMNLRAGFQSDQQQHRAIVAERISALKAYADTVNINGLKVLSTLESAISATVDLEEEYGEHRYPSEAQMRAWQHDTSQVKLEYDSWVAQRNVQLEVCYGLFGPNIIRRPEPIVSRPSLKELPYGQHKSTKQLRSDLMKMRAELVDVSATMVTILESEQSTIVKLSESINS